MARRVQAILQRYKALQDIIAILGMALSILTMASLRSVIEFWMTLTCSVNSASFASVSESFASLACTLLPASISSLFSFARSSASAARSLLNPSALARLD